MSAKFLSEGGTPITAELATELRTLVFGTAAIPIRAEWTQTPFVFGAPKEELAYGLRSARNATRGLLSVVQGFVLKHLLFTRKNIRSAVMQDSLLASADIQREVLCAALVEILRLIADKGKVTIVLPTPDDEVFVTHSATYFHDSITEKLYIFTLSPHEELDLFMKRHYNNFTEEDAPGTLLFLYSAVLTRTMGKYGSVCFEIGMILLSPNLFRIRTDLDSTKSVPLTMNHNEEGSLMISTLLLTGRATPYLHNGVINVGDENSYAVPQYGVLNRCTIGLLLWENDNTQSDAPTTITTRQPGSRLKTPNYPIWVTNCAGHYGVIFNKNPDLLRNYHAESRFDVTYYSCSGHQIAMTVDNRSFNEQASCMLERQASSTENNSLSGRPAKDDTKRAGTGTGVAGGSLACGTTSGSGGSNTDTLAKEESGLNTPLQKLINTKWEDASIRFHVQPSMLSYLFSTIQKK